MKKIGIIGGSGFDNPTLLQNTHELFHGTQWGEPSSPVLEGELNGVAVAMLARHGRKHTLSPSVVNYRANVQTLKDLGCTHILATTAVGSLREDICRGDLVIIDQFIDFTRRRKTTFHDYFAPNQAVHTPMADPFDATMRAALIKQAQQLALPHHASGTVITIEGPRFSTRAESHMFRLWGADIINMSVATEASLANEIGLPYAAIAMSTDYDCWKADEEPVSWDVIASVFRENIQRVETLLSAVVTRL